MLTIKELQSLINLIKQTNFELFLTYASLNENKVIIKRNEYSLHEPLTRRKEILRQF